MPRILRLALFATFSTALAAFAATDSRSLNTAAQSFSINGTVCPEITEWSGGVISGSVVETSLGSANIKKHIGQVAYEPVVAKAVPPLSPQLTALLSDLCNSGSATATLDLVGTDSRSLQAVGAQLIEVQFPALDGSSKSTCEITFVFRVGSVREQTAATRTAPVTPKTSRALASNFSFTLGNLDTTRVASIGAFSIKRGASNNDVGSARDYTVAATGPTQFSNLSVTVSNSGAATWAAWRDDFLVRGNSTETNELSGTVSLLSADMKTALLTLQFSNVGIFRFAPLDQAAGGAIARSRADLYCEKITVAPASSSSTQNTPATPATPATPPTTAPVAPLSPAKTIVPVKALQNPNDTGIRDPAGFPRPAGLTRTGYSKSDYETQLSESASYTTDLDFDALLEAYEKVLAQDGWNKESLGESGTTAENRMILSNWRKDKVQADLRLYAAKKGANVSLTVTTAK